MKEYWSLDNLKKDYPVATQLMLDENKMQFPDAKFVRATVGGLEPHCEDNEDFDLHLMALFDLETPNMSLWIWIPGVDDPYIDEYYEIADEEANSQLALLK